MKDYATQDLTPAQIANNKKNKKRVATCVLDSLKLTLGRIQNCQNTLLSYEIEASFKMIDICEEIRQCAEDIQTYKSKKEEQNND